MESGAEEMKSRNWEGLRRNWPSVSACLWIGAVSGIFEDSKPGEGICPYLIQKPSELCIFKEDD